MMSPTFKKILVLCSLSLVLCLLSIQPGHNWGGDYSMYLAQAKYLLQGDLDVLYTVNQYAMDQSDLPIGPSLYPMGYPVLLAPIYYFFGSNFVILKIFNALFFIGSIPLVFSILRSVSSKKQLAFYGTILFAINFQLVNLADNLGSDFSGMFFGFLSLYLMIKIREFDTWFYVVMLGLSIFTCYSVRTVGLVLVPTLIVFHICQYIKEGKIKLLNVALPYVVFMICYLIYGQLFDSIDSIYLALIENISFDSVWNNVLGYGEYFMGFFVNLKNFPSIVSIITALLFFPIFVIGIWPIITRDNLFLMCYCASMLVLLIVYPFTSIRFIIPLSAFAIYAVLNGLDHLGQRINLNLSAIKWLSKGLVLGVFMQSVLLVFLHQKDGTNESLTLEMQSIYSYINETIPDDKIFVFHKPRVLRYFTDNNGFMLENFNSPKLQQADHLLVKKDGLKYDGFEIQKTWDNFQLMKRKR